MKVVVLASGSRGNCTFIEEKNTRILIDLGMPCSYIESHLKEIGIEPESIDAILITHDHSDHIRGLSVFQKRYNSKVYVMPKLLSKIKINNGICFGKEKTTIKDFNVHIIRTSHDTEESIGFIINDRLVYITDTGYINEKYMPILENKDMYIFESNHDIEMLIDSSYPYYVKQRILGDRGHLSNKSSALYLSKLVGKNTKCIILAHLSEDNNTPAKALETLSGCVVKSQVKDIIVATQDNRTELIEI